MIPETVEQISYRFTHGELAALLKLMDVPELPGVPSVTAAAPDGETVQSLVESGTVMVCGERIFVDKVISLIVKNIGTSQKRLVVTGNKRSLVLLRGPQMCVLADENGGVITLEPLQNVAVAKDRLLEAAGRLPGTLHTAAVGGKGPLGESDGLEGLSSLYGKIMAE